MQSGDWDWFSVVVETKRRANPTSWLWSPKCAPRMVFHGASLFGGEEPPKEISRSKDRSAGHSGSLVRRPLVPNQVCYRTALRPDIHKSGISAALIQRECWTIQPALFLASIQDSSRVYLPNQQGRSSMSYRCPRCSTWLKFKWANPRRKKYECPNPRCRLVYYVSLVRRPQRRRKWLFL